MLGSDGFPALKDFGGFELLRCVPNCRLLEPIQVNIDVKSLKSAIGQGKIFIRPIQRNLSVIPVKREQSTIDCQ